MYANKAAFTEEKLSLTNFSLIRPVDLETQRYQLLEALCMLIELLSLNINLA